MAPIGDRQESILSSSIQMGRPFVRTLRFRPSSVYLLWELLGRISLYKLLSLSDGSKIRADTEVKYSPRRMRIPSLPVIAKAAVDRSAQRGASNYYTNSGNAAASALHPLSYTIASIT
jgi:hypothetical protein